MKTILALILLASTTVMHAAVTLANDAGPYGATSYTSNWVSLAGYNLSARTPGTNTFSFDASVIKHGNPLSSSLYNYKVTVFDYNSGSYFSTTFLASGTGHKTSSISVPSNHSYNITLWVQSSQLADAVNYWELAGSNILITAPF